ncbi:MAG TPA: cystathionine beta-synthase [Chitinispirillaceae bacterium]|jgi:cystathionine beta-synthase|nr:cystathionine beta-synthase [Chitinispirillaceae bacterium]
MANKDVLELIGNTPIVEVKCFDIGQSRLFLKLENQNPGGSIKDRIALSMIEQAEKRGQIKPGDTLIEATAGNTGLGLALVAAQKGYKLLLVIPDKMSREKIRHLKAMGAKVVMTRSDVEKGHPEYYQDYAKRLSQEIPNSYYIDQFNNPDNPLAHETSTGPEIWQQMNHDVDAMVVGVGSGGTIGGLTRFFKKVSSQVEFVLADPRGSILCDFVKSGKLGSAGSWLVEGIGEDFVPAQADFSLVKASYSISDEESFQMCRTLLMKEGILAGSSSGVLIAAAVRYARESKRPKKIVTFVCDSGNKYLSKLYNDQWLADHGLIITEKLGDLRDLIVAKYDEQAVVSVARDDSIGTAYSRMKLYDISQLPVLDGDRIVGIIDESDILLRVTSSDQNAFTEKVETCMSSDLVMVPPRSPIDTAISILQKGLVVIVADKNRFYGLITRIDLLNYLRRQMKGQ